MNTSTLPTTAHSVVEQASAALDQAGDLTHRGAEAVREGVQQVRDKAQNMGDHAVSYIKDEPVKSVLIAAAAGATLMGLLSLMVRGAGRS
jgi:ElaB/YqjD/DUF883 family membrane-anchored ribosome-binding protein